MRRGRVKVRNRVAAGPHLHTRPKIRVALAPCERALAARLAAIAVGVMVGTDGRGCADDVAMARARPDGF